jgi:hypothetical protein
VKAGTESDILIVYNSNGMKEPATVLAMVLEG